MMVFCFILFMMDIQIYDGLKSKYMMVKRSIHSIKQIHDGWQIQNVIYMVPPAFVVLLIFVTSK